MSFFDQGGASVKFENINDSFTGVVTDFREQQQTKYQSKELDYWPNGEAKMQLVVSMQDAFTGEERSLYIPKGGIHKAVGSALRAQGLRDLEIGGTLTVTFIGYGQPKNPTARPPKEYSASYVPAGQGAPAPQAPAPQPQAAPAQAPQAAPAPQANYPMSQQGWNQQAVAQAAPQVQEDPWAPAAPAPYAQPAPQGYAPQAAGYGDPY